MFNIKSLKTKLFLIIIGAILFNLYACSPKMHVIGFGMRQFNLSQNKYSKQNPYIKPKSGRIKKQH